MTLEVISMKSPRTGNAVANQFKILQVENDVATWHFQSYQTRIAKLSKGELVVDPDWDYSITTRKYLFEFLATHYRTSTIRCKKDMLKAIESGEVKVESLN